MHKEDGDGEAKQAAQVLLRVTIVGAGALRKTDTADPFCVCAVAANNDLKFETPVIKDTVSPTWDHTREISDFETTSSLKFTTNYEYY